MTDCSNIDMRDALPDYLHGTLEDVARERVQVHLDLCGDCQAELRLLRAVLVSTLVPRIDVVRIAGAIPPYRRRVWLNVASLRLAAAVLLAAVGVSVLPVTQQRRPHSTQGIAFRTTGVSLVGVGELSDDGLEQLIAAMDHLEAVPPADPDPIAPVMDEGGG